MIRFLKENWVFFAIAALGWYVVFSERKDDHKIRRCVESGGEYEKCVLLVKRGLFDGSKFGP